MNDASVEPIIALIPAFNEVQRIGVVVELARKFLPVLVVDDGSMDNTAKIAEAAGAQVLVQKPNQGKGAALRAGFGRAISECREAVITLDADGQHDPEEIPVFLDAFRTHRADLIIGTRDFRLMPPVRRFGNTVGEWVFSTAMGRRVRDNQSGYRLISRQLMEKMLASSERGFEFEVEMIAMAVRQGMKIDEVLIRTIYAGESSHIRPGHHVVNYFRVVWQAWQKRRA